MSNTVERRIIKDIELGYIPKTYMTENKNDKYELYFKINVYSDYEMCYQIGSFIRTVVSLLTQLDTYKIVMIIDLTSFVSLRNLNIRKIINRLIYVSSASVILTNVFLVFPPISKLFLKQKKECNQSNRAIIIDIEHMNNLLHKHTEFNIDNKFNCHAFNNFDLSKHYISATFIKHIFTNIYSPFIFQLSSYNLNCPILDKSEYIKCESNNTYFILCVQKVSNVCRINNMIERYNNIKNNITLCLSSIGSDNVIKQCDEYKIKYHNLSETIEVVRKFKNVIAVDIHKEAISLQYNKNYNLFNDSVVVFGYELGGIPKELLDLTTKYVQIKARKSINVVAAFSIILSILY